MFICPCYGAYCKKFRGLCGKKWMPQVHRNAYSLNSNQPSCGKSLDAEKKRIQESLQAARGRSGQRSGTAEEISRREYRVNSDKTKDHQGQKGTQGE